jgi:cation diffusion facilitator CzcD-associated flavoprotein CzcO
VVNNNMSAEHWDTIIVGGGHAGVNLACMLEKEQPERRYLLLEKKTLLNQWHDKRWDGFKLNTPHGYSKLYGQEDELPGTTLGQPIATNIQCGKITFRR